jgi:hypothetical protein
MCNNILHLLFPHCLQSNGVEQPLAHIAVQPEAHQPTHPLNLCEAHQILNFYEIVVTRHEFENHEK